MKKLYLLIIGLALLIIPITLILIDRKNLEKNGIYVIGLITDIEDGLKRSYFLNYKFEYIDSVYLSTDQIYKNRKDLVGKRFIVRFLPDAPKTSEILYDKQIFCDTLKAPTNGWKKIPEYFAFFPKSIAKDMSGNYCRMYITQVEALKELEKQLQPKSNIKQSSKTFFLIQLGSYSKQIDKNIFNKKYFNESIILKTTNNKYQYYISRKFKTKKEANLYIQHLVKRYKLNTKNKPFTKQFIE